jgi:hypothetical protein
LAVGGRADDCAAGAATAERIRFFGIPQWVCRVPA